MGGDVVKYQPRAVERLGVNQVQAIANTELIPPSLRGNVPAIMATIIKGRALGLDDMHALTAIHFIEGKPTLAAETMVLLARRAGHSIVGEYGDGQVTVRGKRVDTGDEMSVTWTSAMAERAGLLSKQNWKRYPESMLWARAASQLCRMLFADVLAGAGYTPEELEPSPEERVSEAMGQVGPPPETPAEQPDDRIGGQPADDPDVVDAEATPVTDSEEEPQPAEPGERPAAGGDAGSPASMPVTGPGSSSDDEPAPDVAPAPTESGAAPEGNDGETGAGSEPQQSIFEQRAAEAQRRRGQHKDPAA